MSHPRVSRAFRSPRALGVALRVGLAVLASGGVSCASSPPAQVEDLCQIFDEKGGWFENWHKAAKHASSAHGVSVPILMATIYQESRFQPKARPPRTRLLGFIPWSRTSSAYGFGQAKDGTWKEYQQKTGRRGADRDKFKDAVDFVGWYHANTHRRYRVPVDNAYALYLAYHEGLGGFGRRTYDSKDWLKRVAHKVARRADLYARQYDGCRK
jgi:hypothetical protein